MALSKQPSSPAVRTQGQGVRATRGFWVEKIVTMASWSLTVHDTVFSAIYPLHSRPKRRSVDQHLIYIYIMRYMCSIILRSGAGGARRLHLCSCLHLVDRSCDIRIDEIG